MVDLSLGPLRIANPDDASPDTPSHLQQHTLLTAGRTSSNERESAEQTNVLNTNGKQPDSNIVSPSEQPRFHPTSSRSTESSAVIASSLQRTASDQSSRHSTSHVYPDLLQAQSTAYPLSVSRSQQPSRMTPGRLNAPQYASASATAMGNGIARQDSGRNSGYGYNSPVPPARNASKRATSVQAGVPSLEEAHTERTYRPHAYSQGSDSAPHNRLQQYDRSTRVGGSVPSAAGPLASTPMSSQSHLSSSPYHAEGGPLSSSEEWKEKGAAIGVQHGYDVNGRPVTKSIKKGVKDFNFGQTLGEGSYSTVLAATDRQTMKDYAIKVLDKRHIIKEKKVKYVNIEKETLNRLTDHPGVVRLYYTFQDERSLYFVLDLCNGGELLGVLKRMGTFDEECTRFYGAQILDTISYMHNKGVIHRDLKPENVLMDEKMHIKITDFGTAKMLNSYKDAGGRLLYELDSTTNDRASSFVGTAEYVSPELLTDKNACKASDLWAFGCIIYQLLAGRPPFKAANEYLTFQKIVALEYEFPKGFPDVARTLVERLLVLDPSKRLTLENVKAHPFFAGVKWGKGLWSQKAPRLRAYIPPAAAPIKLDGPTLSRNQGSDGYASHNTHPTILPPTNTPAPNPRIVTEVAPPSQLDIEWSPVLTRNNERILKLGNLSVFSCSLPHSPGHESGNKFSRFFGGGSTKKRQRLVMVTSSARIIVAASGGEEKKSKQEIGLLSPGTEVNSSTDGKGITSWIVNTRDKQFIFEDVKPVLNDPPATAASTREWLDVIERAKELATSQAPASAITYAGDDQLTMPSSAFSSHASSVSQPNELGQSASQSQSHSGRGMFHNASTSDNDSLKGRKRFSKRQSKSGLTAVF